jgi:hypothetical protein
MYDIIGEMKRTRNIEGSETAKLLEYHGTTEVER